MALEGFDLRSSVQVLRNRGSHAKDCYWEYKSVSNVVAGDVLKTVSDAHLVGYYDLESSKQPFVCNPVQKQLAKNTNHQAERAGVTQDKD